MGDAQSWVERERGREGERGREREREREREWEKEWERVRERWKMSDKKGRRWKSAGERVRQWEKEIEREREESEREESEREKRERERERERDNVMCSNYYIKWNLTSNLFFCQLIRLKWNNNNESQLNVIKHPAATTVSSSSSWSMVSPSL